MFAKNFWQVKIQTTKKFKTQHRCKRRISQRSQQRSSSEAHQLHFHVDPALLMSIWGVMLQYRFHGTISKLFSSTITIPQTDGSCNIQWVYSFVKEKKNHLAVKCSTVKSVTISSSMASPELRDWGLRNLLRKNLRDFRRIKEAVPLLRVWRRSPRNGRFLHL